MGMYTELVLGVELVEPCPQQVVDVLDFMVNGFGRAEGPQLPDHPLFSTSRWRHMLVTDSYYFAGDTHSTFIRDQADFWTLTVRCNLKNYDGEIEKLIDWITPYVAETGFRGYWRYEEDDEPTLIHFGDPS